MTLPTHVEEARTAACFVFCFLILQDAKRTKTDPNNRGGVKINLKEKPQGGAQKTFKIQSN